jgi:glutamyl-tRNA synthetase/nondiscriminating glutamyl-tRNA synthetase
VRVRFAPSPTGQLHVGNARTALFNWLFAKKNGGVNVLRIEDTDVDRSEVRFEQQLHEDLRWLGLDWQEGPDVGGPYAPYRQSERTKVYHDYAERLIADGKAYLCFCTTEELEAERQKALAEHRAQVYSGKCRACDPKESQQRRANGEAAAIRLKIPEHPIKFHDLVHGEIEFPNEAVSDPIIVRSTGMPVYNYVVVIDDIEMKITHVIRGDDHLSNTPKQVALYEALGAKVPEFAHLSTILGSDRERLSKRHGATSIAHFREMGVLPEALVNYLALLGWAPHGGTRETFTREELIKEFELERVTPSPAVFDMQKLYWLNRHYIAQAAPQQLFELSLPFFSRARFVTAPDATAREWLGKVIALLAPSVDKLDELPGRAALIFNYDAKSALEIYENRELFHVEQSKNVARTFAALARSEAGLLSAERFKAIMNEVKAKTGAKGKDLFHPVRVALTGSHSGPEFDKLIPIIEQGSILHLPTHVKSVRERLDEFEALL